jgi:hypothetical protein
MSHVLRLTYYVLRFKHHPLIFEIHLYYIGPIQ